MSDQAREHDEFVAGSEDLELWSMAQEALREARQEEATYAWEIKEWEASHPEEVAEALARWEANSWEMLQTIEISALEHLSGLSEEIPF
jgi:hypothetical protein